jgi:hypothetical protein
MTLRFDAPCAPRGQYPGNTRYTSCTQLKETKIMAVLTLVPQPSSLDKCTGSRFSLW